MKVGRKIQQPTGYKAFVLESFPPKKGFNFSADILLKATEASTALGKLDGVTLLLPDLDFFLLMYIRKDASSSSQIEGTKATMIDAIEAELEKDSRNPKELNDAEDILYYIRAIKYGLDRLKTFPLSLRFIKEIHGILMNGARSSHFSNPGNFRTTQNWISGTNPQNAAFVPPPPHEMLESLSDLEKFMMKEDNSLPIIKIAIIHAHFETIHPFADGNGRTGRILITLYLWARSLLEHPILFLSSYFKKHKKLYYEKLDKYHENDDIEGWLHFFLDGIIEVSQESIATIKNIIKLKERDMKKLQSLGKVESDNSIKVLFNLFQSPIVNSNVIQKWTGYTRAGAAKVIKRFIKLGILVQKDQNEKYGISYIYTDYINIFKD